MKKSTNQAKGASLNCPPWSAELRLVLTCSHLRSLSSHQGENWHEHLVACRVWILNGAWPQVKCVFLLVHLVSFRHSDLSRNLEIKVREYELLTLPDKFEFLKTWTFSQSQPLIVQTCICLCVRVFPLYILVCSDVSTRVWTGHLLIVG